MLALLAADAAEPRSWWDGQPFDAILLDAPCSASGIVRRHPDIRWLRRSTDIDALAQTQARLLDALWPLLEPGGRLLYCTCSVFRAEGQPQIDAFLQRQPDARPRRRRRSPGHLLPLADNPSTSPAPASTASDGFFHALLTKDAEPPPLPVPPTQWTLRICRTERLHRPGAALGPGGLVAPAGACCWRCPCSAAGRRRRQAPA